MWPPKSPNLNPCDFWMRCAIEERSNARAHEHVSSPKKSIEKAASSINPMEAKRVCGVFGRQPEMVKKAHGGHIE